MAQKYTMQFHVPVYVFVEIDRNDRALIRKVVVDDEADLRDGTIYGYEGDDPVADVLTVDRIQSLIDDCLDWPAWQFGW